MSRKSPCLNHPLYREACRRYITALGEEFHDHPAIIGWQLDNEIEYVINNVCYNDSCELAWHRWLEQTFHTPEEFNRRLDLVNWGMKVDSLAWVPQPRAGVESSWPPNLHAQLPALSLAELRFRADTVLGFLAEQATILRNTGARQWMLTDWVPRWLAVADTPKAQSFMSIAGLNYYPPSADEAHTWADDPWQFDMHRSCYGKGRFLVTETRFGSTGGAEIWDPAPTREQFRMWNILLAAFGASGLLYWTGNRWRGGHWPHWGGLVDWSGQTEPDFPWVVELGEFFAKWGPMLLANPVESRAAVLTDFDNRSALEIYPHISKSQSVFTETFSALHRSGIGTDTLNSFQAERVENLSRYELVLLPAMTALNNPRVNNALHQYVLGGGKLLVTPFTAYTDNDGIFRGDGFAANLSDLTGGLVRTVRWTGSPQFGGRKQLFVKWNAPMSGRSPAGLDGYMEYLEIHHPNTEIIGTFESDQKIINGKPAATIRTIGRGQVIKLAFWPGDDSFLSLLRAEKFATRNLLAEFLPEGAMAVPRADKSLFVVNTTAHEKPLALQNTAWDRISKRSISPNVMLQPYEALWLEAQ